jgi:hypothetical protein
MHGQMNIKNVKGQIHTPAAASLLKETQYQIERQQLGLKIGMDSMAKRTLSGPVRKNTPVPPSSKV